MQAYDPAASQAEAVFGAARDLFDTLVVDLGTEAMAACFHDVVEDFVDVRGREVLRQLVQGHLDLRAMRERQQHSVQVTGTDGVVRRSVEPGHVRQLTTRFGRVHVERLAYRAKGCANLYPADVVLNLPEEMHSHSLRKMAAVEAVRGSFDAARDAISKATGAGVGKRQVEQLTVRAAADIGAFYSARCPQPCTDATLLVLSVDGKGVVMRPDALRTQTAKAAATKATKGGNRFKTRLAGGEKLGRKRMATLGAVYDADPVPRRPSDVICPAIGPVEPSTDTGADTIPDIDTDEAAGKAAGPTRGKGPRACGKWLTGSIADTSAEVVAATFDQADQRDPTHRRPWVVLVDGATHQLDLIHAEAACRGVGVHILVDFIHVLEYLWKAAWCFHEQADPAAETWVAAHAPDHPGGPQRPSGQGDPGPGRYRWSQPGQAQGRRGLHRLPAGQEGVSGLRHRAHLRLADRHRRHRGCLPPPDQRPPRHHWRPLGNRRRRSRPQTPRPPQQRRLRHLLHLAPQQGAPTRPPSPLPRRPRPRRIVNNSLEESCTHLSFANEGDTRPRP